MKKGLYIITVIVFAACMVGSFAIGRASAPPEPRGVEFSVAERSADDSVKTVVHCYVKDIGRDPDGRSNCFALACDDENDRKCGETAHIPVTSLRSSTLGYGGKNYKPDIGDSVDILYYEQVDHLYDAYGVECSFVTTMAYVPE